MNPYAGLAIAVVVVAAFGGTYAKGRADGSAIATAKSAVRIDNQRAEVDRKNATIVRGDQALIVAKTEDKEKIVTIYRTIREQSEKQIVEVPVYRSAECAVPADGMRLIAAAAAGNLPANPAGAARDPGPAAASSKR